MKHQINHGCAKVPAEEIDILLERHSDVAETCALDLPDPVSVEAVAAVIKLGARVDASSVRAWCRERCQAGFVLFRVFVLAAPAHKSPVSDKDFAEALDVFELGAGFFVAAIDCFGCAVEFGQSDIGKTRHEQNIRRIAGQSGA